MATYFIILAWRIPWTEEPDRLQSIGLQRVGHDSSVFSIHEKWLTSGYIWKILMDIFVDSLWSRGEKKPCNAKIFSLSIWKVKVQFTEMRKSVG